MNVHGSPFLSLTAQYGLCGDSARGTCLGYGEQLRASRRVLTGSILMQPKSENHFVGDNQQKEKATHGLGGRLRLSSQTEGSGPRSTRSLASSASPKPNNPVKTWAEDMTDISPKKTPGRLTCDETPHITHRQGITTQSCEETPPHASGGPELATQGRAGVGEEAEKGSPGRLGRQPVQGPHY